jgi:hypothetical protein
VAEFAGLGLPVCSIRGVDSHQLVLCQPPLSIWRTALTQRRRRRSDQGWRRPSRPGLCCWSRTRRAHGRKLGRSGAATSFGAIADFGGALWLDQHLCISKRRWLTTVRGGGPLNRGRPQNAKFPLVSNLKHALLDRGVERQEVTGLECDVTKRRDDAGVISRLRTKSAGCFIAVDIPPRPRRPFWRSRVTALVQLRAGAGRSAFPRDRRRQLSKRRA